MCSGIGQTRSELLTIETIGLTRATLEQIAAIGSLMEFLGHGEHHLHTTFTHRAILLN